MGAPACILLDRTVAFRRHPQETEEPSDDSGERAKRVATKPPTTATVVLESRQDMEASIARYLVAVTPGDLEVVQPPDVSSLTMHPPLSSSAPIPDHGCWFLHKGAVAAAADKNLLVLSPHSGRPSYSYHRWYLILDLDAAAAASSSSSSSLSAIPGIRFEYTDSYRSAGYGTVIMTRKGGAFLLADLLFDLPGRSREGRALLCLWQSRVCSWVYKHVDLPAAVRHTWRTHMAFPVQSSSSGKLMCWVDLLHGLLLWDLGSELFSFVPLPHGCSVSDDQHPRCRWSLTPQEFRNAACVDGTIKFLTMDGFMERGPISLVTYALDLDNPPQPTWMADTKMPLKDLWTDRTFVSDSEHVPRRVMFPILSTVEHDLLYLVVPGDVECVEGCRFRGVKLLLSVDTRKTRVISATKQKHARPLVRWCYQFAATVSLSNSKYHLGAAEASAKRMKFE